MEKDTVTLKQIIHNNLQLFVNSKIDLDYLVKDSLIIYGHKNTTKMLDAYAKHYEIGKCQVDINMDNVKHYIKSGDILRNGINEL